MQRYIPCSFFVILMFDISAKMCGGRYILDFSVQVKHTLFSVIDEMNDHRWLFMK